MRRRFPSEAIAPRTRSRMPVIKSERDHRRTLARIERLMAAKPNTPEGARLDALATAVEAWEATHVGLERELAEGVAPRRKMRTMDIDEDKIDRAVLALLHLTLHDDWRAWKGFDWDAMNRLHAKGYIHDPVNKTKSVVFTEEGLRESKRLLEEMFGKREAAGGGAPKTSPRKRARNAEG